MAAMAPGVAARWAETLFCSPAHGESTGRFASLPEFARALGDVAGRVGPIHGLVGPTLGGAAVIMAMRHGVEARRVVLLAPPADVRSFSDRFARSLAIAPTVQETMPAVIARTATFLKEGPAG
jgi:hypothetical protein